MKNGLKMYGNTIVGRGLDTESCREKSADLIPNMDGNPRDVSHSLSGTSAKQTGAKAGLK